jgi:hypothetical protein
MGYVSRENSTESLENFMDKLRREGESLHE